MEATDKPELSVVITVDFHAGEEIAAAELRAVFSALAEQEDRECAEILLVESESLRARLPTELASILPQARTLFVAARTAAAMKNAGVAAARGDLIAMLDGDCVPAPGWLRACLSAAREQSDASVISGRTLYPGESLVHRTMALLNRAYIEGDDRGTTSHVSQNNAVYRRAALESAPFVDEGGTHSSRLQSERLRRGGARFGFSPAMTVTHGFAGWGTERQIRADLGYSVVAVRRADPKIPHAWMIRFGIASAPIVFAARLLHSWQLCIKHHRRYRVAASELPLAMAIAVATCALELPGVARALRGQPRPASGFR